MAYFPFYMEIGNKHCLLVGGGIVALRKAEVLLPFGVKLFVVAPMFCDEMIALARESSTQVSLTQREYQVSLTKREYQISLTKREYQDSDLEGMDFVIAASSDPELNHHISVLCKEKNLLVNVVDVKEECSFIVPAILHKDSYTIAVSSGGKSPAAASYLKRRVEEAIPDHYSRLVAQMGEYRDHVKLSIDHQTDRAAAFQELLEAGLDNDCSLNDEIVARVINKYIGGQVVEN